MRGAANVHPVQPGNHAHSGSAGSAGFNGQTGGYTPPPSQAATYVPAQAQTSRASQDRYSNRFGSWRYGRYPFRFYPAGYYVYYGGYYGPGDYFGYYPGDQAFGYTNPDLYPGLMSPRNPLPVTTITLVNPDFEPGRDQLYSERRILRSPGRQPAGCEPGVHDRTGPRQRRPARFVTS